MKRYFLITMLLSICSLSLFADVTGEVPATGSSYYIYNVGQQKYLTVSGTTVTLSETGTQFTVAASTTSGTYTLTASEGKLSTNYLDYIMCSDAGYYNDWKFTAISGTSNAYALGVLEDEDAYSFSYIYYNTANECVSKISSMPELANGQWMFTTEAGTDPEPEPVDEKVSEVTIIEGSEFTIPENMEDKVTVYLYMSNRTKDYKTTICLPFKMSNSQMRSAFGSDTKLYYYNSSTTTTLSFISCNLISAGIPYLMIPSDDEETAEETEIRENAAQTNADLEYMRLYKIENVKSSSFTSEPLTITNSTWSFTPVFEDTTLPTNCCSYQADGVFRRIKTSSSILPAYQAYFVNTTSGAKILPGEILDDVEWSTGIVEVDSDDEPLTIYNINGQLVRENAQSTEGLAKGIYIVNGKKMMIK